MQFYPTCGGRDVIPNKTTQFALRPLGNGAVTQQKGPQETNPVVLRQVNRTRYENYNGILSNPAPFYTSGNNPVYNTEYWLEATNRSLTDGPNVQRPGGPSLGRGNAADVLSFGLPSVASLTAKFTKGQEVSGYQGDNSRINPTHLRQTQKDTGMLLAPNRPFQSNRTLAPQYTEFGVTENRKVTPLIQREIDPSLIGPWLQNPYTHQINPFGSVKTQKQYC